MIPYVQSFLQVVLVFEARFWTESFYFVKFIQKEDQHWMWISHLGNIADPLWEESGISSPKFDKEIRHGKLFCLKIELLVRFKFICDLFSKRDLLVQPSVHADNNNLYRADKNII